MILIAKRNGSLKAIDLKFCKVLEVSDKHLWVALSETASEGILLSKHGDKTFYLQTKNPSVFEALNELCGFPRNVKLGITLETNLEEFNTPSSFKKYGEISKAPKPIDRWVNLYLIDYVTIEPILDFDEEFACMIKCLRPEFVYIGYDNHNCKLPEPPLEKTLRLIEELEKFTEVRLKTIRKAWWEVDDDGQA